MASSMLQQAVCHSNRIIPAARAFRCRAISSFESPPGRAARFAAYGNPLDVVKIENCPGTVLKEKEVSVRMLAAPINPSDINKIEGVYPVGPPPPAVGGNEGVGEVIGTGPGVESVAVSDWVIPAAAGLGTWRDYIVTEETAWCKIRKDIPIEYAATAFINPCTAFRMLEDFVTLTGGHMLVQNGATSIVGQCIIQLAHLKDVQTVNIIRERSDFEDTKRRLETLGATSVFTENEITNNKDLVREMKKAKLGFNCVGGAAATAVMKLLEDDATMVTYGGMSKKPITVSTSSMIFKGIQLKGFWLQKWVSKHSHKDVAAMVDYLLGLVHEGKLVYSMEKVHFQDFNFALEKALGKHGSAPKQVLVF